MTRFNAPRLRFDAPRPGMREQGMRFAPPRTNTRRPLPVMPPAHAFEVAAQPRRQNARSSSGPYGAFARRYTDDGGVELSFDEGPDTFAMHCLKAAVTGSLVMAELGLAVAAFPALEQAELLLLIGGFVLTTVQWLVLFGGKDTSHTIEIRPDCMILDRRDVFWLENMELGWPMLRPEPNDEWTLVGTYGTRNVEFLTIRKIDENDRTPQVFASYLRHAMDQVWSRPGSK
jgi:hypothetical protein